MQVNSKTRYAIKILELLSTEGTKKGRDITEKLEISAPYFEQVVSVLIAEGIVKSVRGCNGGYKLCDKANDQKTLWDVISIYNTKSWNGHDGILDSLAKEFIAIAKGRKLCEI